MTKRLISQVVTTCLATQVAACFFAPPKPTEAVSDAPNSGDGQQPDGVVDAPVTCVNQLPATDVVNSFRNGHAGDLNNDGLDDLAIHGMRGTEPRVWVYYGRPAGIKLACPDHTIVLSGAEKVGALRIDDVTNAAENELLVTVQADTRVWLEVHRFPVGGAAVKKATVPVTPMWYTPTWEDEGSRGGFIAVQRTNGVAMTADIYFGGGQAIFATRSNGDGSLSTVTEHEQMWMTAAGGNVQMAMPDPGAQSIRFLNAARADNQSYSSLDRRSKSPTNKFVIGPDSLSMQTANGSAADMLYPGGAGRGTEGTFDAARYFDRTANTIMGRALRPQLMASSAVESPRLELFTNASNAFKSYPFGLASTSRIRDFWISEVTADEVAALVLSHEEYGDQRQAQLDACLLPKPGVDGGPRDCGTDPISLDRAENDDLNPPFLVVGKFASVSDDSAMVIYNSTMGVAAVCGSWSPAATDKFVPAACPQ